jgi:nucleotide-binding universal stress UspA family protein
MNEIVVPICDAGEAAWAANQAIAAFRDGNVRIHLLNVQRPLPRHVSRFFSGRDLREFHHEAGMRVLEPAARLLDDAGIPHEDHVMVGHQAETIVRFAEEHHSSQVIVDAVSKPLLGLFRLGSIGSQVQHLMQAHAQSAEGSASSAG